MMRGMRIILQTLPHSTNTLYANSSRGRRLTERGRDNKEAMTQEAWMQYRGEPLEGPLWVSIELYWPTKRNHDVDNIKGLLDAMKGILWVDDGQIVDLHIRKAYDPKNPRVELDFGTVDNDV